MTANQTKFLLSGMMVLVGTAMASPFYWFFSVRHTATPSTTASVATPAAVAEPGHMSAGATKSILAVEPSVADTKAIVPPLSKLPVSEQHKIVKYRGRAARAIMLGSGSKTYSYTVSGKVQGAKLPERIELLLRNDRFGEREQFAKVASDGSFAIRGTFHDQAPGELGWRLITVPSDGSSTNEVSGRLILTDNTDLALERTLVLLPS